jgi:adenylyl-sulfate kinase
VAAAADPQPVDGVTLWLTGLPAAGKTTLAHEIQRLAPRPCERLDGDELRATLNRDLGFSRADRATSCARTGDLALELARRPSWVVVAHLSPFAADRALVRRRHAAAGVAFVEVHVATPLATCRRRDPKRLYERAERGELTGLTGYDAPYEAPRDPEVAVAPGDLAEQARLVLSHPLLTTRR